MEQASCLFLILVQDVNLKRGRLRFTVGWGRVYSDCWYLLDIVGEPAPTVRGRVYSDCWYLLDIVGEPAPTAC